MASLVGTVRSSAAFSQVYLLFEVNVLRFLRGLTKLIFVY